MPSLPFVKFMIRHAAVLLLAGMAGCYSYRPVSAHDSRLGRRVRVTLTDAGTADLAAHLGPSTMTVSGLVVENAGEAYLISVLGTRTRSGREIDWAGEQVSIPRPLIRELEQRSFSRTRTVVATIGLAAAAAVVRQIFWGPGGTFSGAPPGGNPGPR